MPDLQRIDETMDRSWSLRLFAQLCGSEDDEMRQRLARSLGRLEDPRLEQPLAQVLLDPSQPPALRRVCGELLRRSAFVADPSDAALRGWWASGDPILEHHAMGWMGAAQRDIVAKVAADPSHPYFVEALKRLVVAFPPLEAVGMLVPALRDGRPEIRRAAALNLMWDEPLQALDALLRTAQDDVPEVAAAALETLIDYPTSATARVAAALRAHMNSAVRDAASHCFNTVREAVRAELPEAEERLRAQFASTWQSLDLGEPEPEPDPYFRAHGCRHLQAYRWMVSSDAFHAHFGRLDTAWEGRRRALQDADWSAVPASERAELGDMLLSWPDGLVRDAAIDAFVMWDDASRARSLLDDPCFLVRKTTMYGLRWFGPNPALAARAWAYLAGVSSPTHRYETVSTAIALSETGSWFERAGALLVDESEYEMVRCTAAYALADAGARDELETHLGILRRPPTVTWRVHQTLVDCALQLDLALPDLSHLRDVDHLAAQVMLVEAGQG